MAALAAAAMGAALAPGVVPLMAMMLAEEDAAMEAASSDLKFLMPREQVDNSLQVRFYHMGIVSVRQYAAIAKDAEDPKDLVRSGGFGLDPTGTLLERVKTSKLIVAWESAKARASKLAEAEGESEVRQEPKMLKGTDYLGMKNAFEAWWWELENKKTPPRRTWRRSSP